MNENKAMHHLIIISAIVLTQKAIETICCLRCRPIPECGLVVGNALHQ